MGNHFENRVLRNIFGPKCEEGTGDQRQLHNEEFLDFYSALNIIQVIKSRRIRQVGHLVCTRERRYIHGFGGET